MNSIQKTARMAGLLYLIYMVTTISADVFGRSALIISGNAAATASNIAAHEWQFRLAFVDDLVSYVFFFLAAWALYSLLKSVNKNLAVLFMLLNLAGVAIAGFNDLNLVAAWLFSRGADYLNVFRPDQQQAMAMLFLNLYDNAYWITQIFFAVWLFPLGYLVFKSGFLPRLLGIIMMVHWFFWSMTFFCHFLFPAFTAITAISFPLGFISEFGLTIWLLIKGVNLEQWKRHTLAYT
jgi:hypothetical protein